MIAVSTRGCGPRRGCSIQPAGTKYNFYFDLSKDFIMNIDWNDEYDMSDDIDYIVAAREALETLRNVRNSVSRNEFCRVMRGLAHEDCNRVEPMILAGNHAHLEFQHRSQVLRNTPKGEEPDFSLKVS